MQQTQRFAQWARLFMHLCFSQRFAISQQNFRKAAVTGAGCGQMVSVKGAVAAIPYKFGLIVDSSFLVESFVVWSASQWIVIDGTSTSLTHSLTHWDDSIQGNAEMLLITQGMFTIVIINDKT